MCLCTGERVAPLHLSTRLAIPLTGDRAAAARLPSGSRVAFLTGKVRPMPADPCLGANALVWVPVVTQTKAAEAAPAQDLPDADLAGPSNAPTGTPVGAAAEEKDPIIARAIRKVCLV